MALNIHVLFYTPEFTTQDQNFVMRVLTNRKRGFGRAFGFCFGSANSSNPMRIKDTHNPYFDRTVILFKLGSDRIKRMYPRNTDIHGMSFTYVHKSPCIIVFNADNWARKPGKFKESQDDYLTYLINHEFGHALGIHEHQTHTKELCHLMYQQTRGTEKCSKTHIYPTDEQIRFTLRYVKDHSKKNAALDGHQKK